MLRRLFGELGVQARDTEMSMSIRDEATGTEYAGGRGVKGFVARPRQLFDREFVGMLRSVTRFHALAAAFLEQTTDDDTTTYGEFIRDGGFPESFTRLYAVPLVACVWSSGSGEAMHYPARYLFRFLEHHGMLTVGDSPQWMTVVGGSRTYVDALAERLPAVRSGDPVTSVLRTPRRGRGAHRLGPRRDLRPDRARAARRRRARHPRRPDAGREGGARRVPLLAERDRAAPRRLADAARAPCALVVELPRRHRPGAGRDRHLLDEPAPGPARRRAFYVTLNATDRIDPATVVATMQYRHPLYDLDAVRRSGDCASSPRGQPRSPARTTGGASTRTAAGRGSRPPQPSGCAW